MAYLRAERNTMTVSENPYSQGLAYVDGEVCALADARLPLVEAGFTRSDVTYDVVAVWNGKFFRLDDHLARFQRSRDLLHLEPQENTPDIRRILMQLVSRSRRCGMIAPDRVIRWSTALAVLGVAVVAAVVSCEHVRSPRLLSSC